MKKFTLAALLIIVLALAASAVSAAPGDGPRRPGDRPHGGGEIIELIAEQTGLSPREIMQALRGGATLADVITENSGDVQAVIGAMVAQVTERVNAAVEAGTIDQERAGEILSDLEARITAMVNEGVDRPLGDRPGPRGDRSFGGGPLREYLEEAGLTMADVREALESGQTLGDILTDVGIDLDTLTADIINQAETRLAERVEAGEITQERADELLIRLQEWLEQRLNGEEPSIASADV
ncbi:MAG: hypothetical protein ACOCYT_01880 [Chloroflexota bacterium]